MRNIHQFNSGFVIINIVLGFTIYLGLLFLIVLGIAQVMMAIIMIINEKKLTREIAKLLSLYCIITTIVLIVALFMYCKFIPTSDVLLYIELGVSVLLAFFHLYITYLVDKMLKSESENLQIKKGLIT